MEFAGPCQPLPAAHLVRQYQDCFGKKQTLGPYARSSASHKLEIRGLILRRYCGICVALLLTTVGAARATTYLYAASPYNVFVQNNFTLYSSDVQGGVAAGGTINVSAISLALGTSASAFPGGYSVVGATDVAPPAEFRPVSAGTERSPPTVATPLRPPSILPMPSRSSTLSRPLSARKRPPAPIPAPIPTAPLRVPPATRA